MRLLLGAIVLVAAVQSAACAADDFKLEEGFKLLFDGKDLTGWKVKKDGTALDGKTDAANKRFVVMDKKLVIDAKVKGDVIIETKQTFAKDVHIKFDFLPGTGCNNDLYIRGLKFDIKKEDVKNLKFGEWNTFEIVIVGKTAEFKCNGESIKKMDAKDGATAFGVRAELGPMEMKNVRAKE